MKISMTPFLDYLVSDGPSKVSQVRRAKRQLEVEYQPAADYYKPVRDNVVALHRDGRAHEELYRAIERAHPSRQRHYRACVDGYLGWLGRRQVDVLEPLKGEWQHEGLTVRVNPELHLVVAGSPCLVKLYWKSEPLSKRRLDSALQLMHETCGDHADGAIAVLDVRRSKLYTFNGEKPNVPVYLRAEAITFVSLWDQV